jgi:FAD/FMN-containing dehydrogenase
LPNKELVEGQSGARRRYDSSHQITWKKRRQTTHHRQQFARENELLVAVRGGGHNVSGKALCDDGIVIDLSGMRGIHVDAKNHSARVQAGATLRDVDRETHVFGLAVPAGVISKTGIAGLTLGGGVGWLVRKYGLTCDNVLSLDIVTADGKPRVASGNENEDLFWALRGGGGNFGVVTSFEFRVHPVSTVLGGLVMYPRDRADVIQPMPFPREFSPSHKRNKIIARKIGSFIGAETQ